MNFLKRLNGVINKISFDIVIYFRVYQISMKASKNTNETYL